MQSGDITTQLGSEGRTSTDAVEVENDIKKATFTHIPWKSKKTKEWNPDIFYPLFQYLFVYVDDETVGIEKGIDKFWEHVCNEFFTKDESIKKFLKNGEVIHHRTVQKHFKDMIADRKKFFESGNLSKEDGSTTSKLDENIQSWVGAEDNREAVKELQKQLKNANLRIGQAYRILNDINLAKYH